MRAYAGMTSTISGPADNRAENYRKPKQVKGKCCKANCSNCVLMPKGRTRNGKRT